MGGAATSSRVAFVAVLATVATAGACAGDDDPVDETVSITGAGSGSTTLGDGVVRIVLESPSAQFDDTITLDVTADAAAVNDSGVYANCTSLDESPSAGGLVVGVTDVRRLDSDAALISIEVVSVEARAEPGEYDATMSVLDRRQRSSDLTGTITTDGLRGTLAMTTADGVQVRGSYECARSADDLATATTTAAALRLVGLDVRLAVDGDGSPPSLTATKRSMNGVDTGDARAPAHCSGIATPDAEPYVVRLDRRRAARAEGGLVRFALVVRDAADPRANRAELTAVVGTQTISAAGSVRFGDLRTSGTFAGRTQDGEEVTAPFTCQSG